MFYRKLAISAVLTVAALIHPKFTTASESDGLLELMKVLHENKTITSAQLGRLKNALSTETKSEKKSIVYS